MNVAITEEIMCMLVFKCDSIRKRECVCSGQKIKDKTGHAILRDFANGNTDGPYRSDEMIRLAYSNCERDH